MMDIPQMIDDLGKYLRIWELAFIPDKSKVTIMIKVGKIGNVFVIRRVLEWWRPRWDIIVI